MRKLGLLILLQLIISVGFVQAGYSEEFPESYTWAFKNGITTQDTIEKANMYGQINRIELSKMISNYAINVLKKKLDVSKKCEFDDISSKLNKQYDSGVTKSCQLGLMGQGITKFRPYDKVTRAEFGTILSRLLYGDQYNGGNPYYKKHLNQLNIKGIMTNISNAEKGNEIRGNVMVMLKRSETLGNKIPTFEELDTMFRCPSCEDDEEEGCDYFYRPDRGFIIPYKDGYIGYSWRDNIGDEFLNLTYRKLDNPCEIVYQTDEIFHFNGKSGCIIDYGYSKKVVDNFNSKETERQKCMDDIEKYFYNLILGLEEDEIFTLWMDSFKKNIDNSIYSVSWREDFSNCLEKYGYYKGSDFYDADSMNELLSKGLIDEYNRKMEEYLNNLNEYNQESGKIRIFCEKEIFNNLN